MLLHSDEDSKIDPSGLLPPLHRISSMSRNLIHHHHDEISTNEQKEIAKDMVSQMKQLKAVNEAMGFDVEDNQYKIKQTSSNSSENKEKEIIIHETMKLRMKLESISSSINRIRKDLQQKNADSDTKNKDNIIMYFQNQLTEIQDQIEDAHDDIESHIDIKFIKYMEEIKSNKQKLKQMKKDKKEQERLRMINKQKEQQQIIEQQKTQIEQLMKTKTKHSYNTGSYNQSDYFSLDGNDETDEEYIVNNYNMYREIKQPPQPLLSDNVIKLISGVVVILTGVWLISRYFDKSNGNNINRKMLKYDKFIYGLK